MIPETEYLPPRQFARVVGLSESSLAKKRMTGSGPPYVKIGRAVRYGVRTGLEWMAAQTRRSTSEPPESDRRSQKNRHRAATTE
jgi:predicted DNA-binding transcriptional regulator AlpA